VTTAAPADADPQAYNAFVANASLEEIIWHRLHAERTSGEAVSNFDLEVQPEFGRDADHPSSVIYRYAVGVTLKSADESPVGRVEVTLALRFEVKERPEDPVLNLFGGTSGLFMAFPYLRESVQSLADRIGIPGLIIQPLIQSPGELAPKTD